MNGYQAFAVTKTGSSHKKIDKECQDSSCSIPLNYQISREATAIVADGHGDDSCFRSQKGAKFACLCALQGMHDFVKKINLTQENTDEEITKNLIKHIIMKWQIKVQEDYEAGIDESKKSNFTVEELAQASEKYRKRYENGEALNKAYGTTLIAATVTEDYWLGIHIGDGRFTVLNQDGSFTQPVPWDLKCFLNETTSICDDDAAERARSCFFLNKENPPPVAVFLCSDGVDDNYPVDENEKHLYKLYSTIALAFAEDGFDSTRKQLEDLVEKFATEGKGDDTSIAGFIDIEKLKKLFKDLVEKFATEGKGSDASIANFLDMEKLKKVVQENERVEAERIAKGLCRHCGGEISKISIIFNFLPIIGNFLKKKCKSCGREQ